MVVEVQLMSVSRQLMSVGHQLTLTVVYLTSIGVQMMLVVAEPLAYSGMACSGFGQFIPVYSGNFHLSLVPYMTDSEAQPPPKTTPW